MLFLTLLASFFFNSPSTWSSRCTLLYSNNTSAVENGHFSTRLHSLLAQFREFVQRSYKTRCNQNYRLNYVGYVLWQVNRCPADSQSRWAGSALARSDSSGGVCGRRRPRVMQHGANTPASMFTPKHHPQHTVSSLPNTWAPGGYLHVAAPGWSPPSSVSSELTPSHRNKLAANAS